MGGSTGSSSSTSSGGNTGSSGSGGSGSGGYYQLKNNGNGQCLKRAEYGITTETCSDGPATSWAYKSGSNGTYQLVNESTGTCLTASASNALQMGECDGSTQRLWRTGSGGTLQSMSNSMCVDTPAGWASTATCDSGKVSQRWTRT
ncbi:RICIN domain-containing protein [Streptomyces sp. NPDC001530]|uniref:RICIN domain-containing protein n=1 Tax=Streptomyces sp. NPDC001530 TaxID=3364582 RepID=UPI0036B08628